MRHGGQILVEALKLHGVRRVFSVPGESYLAVLDGLHDAGIQNVVCRHEGGAAMMAEASGKLTGRPGVCLVTRGPGATNASAGVHVARQDSTPMILLIGQIARADRDREAFQEVDYRQMFGGLAKWVGQIEDTDRIPEYMARAFDLAQSGRPGPVVLALPEDMLSALADVPDLPPAPRPVAGISETQLAAIRDAMAGAERPLVIPGGAHWTQADADRLTAFAEGWGLPVAVPFRRQDYMDNRHPNYAGDLGVGMNTRMGEALREADVILSLGSKLGDIADGRLHADGAEGAGAADRACLSGPGRDRAPLARRSGHRCLSSRGAGGAGRGARPAPVGRVDQPAAGALRGLADAASHPRRRADGAGGLLAVREPARGCDHHQWRGQLRRLRAPLFPLQAREDADRADLRLDGLRAAGSDRGQP